MLVTQNCCADAGKADHGACPIRPIGTVSLIDSRPRDAWRPHEQRLLTSLATELSEEMEKILERDYSVRAAKLRQSKQKKAVFVLCIRHQQHLISTTGFPFLQALRLLVLGHVRLIALSARRGNRLWLYSVRRAPQAWAQVSVSASQTK